MLNAPQLHPPSPLEKRVYSVIEAFLLDLGDERALRALEDSARLDEDLGLGSIERVELVRRIEKALQIQLPAELCLQADTVAELFSVIHKASALTKGAVEMPEESFILPSVRKTVVPGIAEAETLTAVLENYAKADPKRPHIYLHTEEGEEEVIRYGQLFEAAATCAQGLLEQGLKKQDSVAIMLPTCKEFFYVFFGILLAGGIPVPIYPPVRRSQIAEYVKRQTGILRNANARFLVTSEEIATVAALLKPSTPDLDAVCTVEKLLTKSHAKLHHAVIQAEDPALIQYTSGSTGMPKGVLLTHNNLLANIRAIGEALNISPKDVIVSWLPLYHDMGLIGAWLGSLYFGIPAVILSPFMFLTKPERWLWAIHYHRGTLSAAPNFAYELCVKKITDEAIEGLDLSSWRLALNGAEAVNPSTLERFTQRFAPYGFSPKTMLPVYGLAEGSVALTFPSIHRKPLIDTIDRQLFASKHEAVPVSEDEPSALRFVSCGKPLAGLSVRLVDNEGREIQQERKVGHLQFKGASVTTGYFNAFEKNAEVFHEGWCDSGDFAYQAGGEFYITGRLKDHIIKAGRNYYPQDLESAAEEVEGLRKGSAVAFGVFDEETGTEKIVIVAEIQAGVEKNKDAVAAQIIEGVTKQIGIPPDDLVLLPPHSVPKTSSGKLRRADCRKDYLNHRLTPQHQSTLLQVLRIKITGIWPQIVKKFKKYLGLIYTAYAMSLGTLMLLPVWFVTGFFPKHKRLSNRLTRWWARWFFRLIGCPVSVQGLEYLDKSKPMVLAPNHASYLDVPVLLAAIPYDVVFVAKNELAKGALKTFLVNQGHILVDRNDVTKSEAGLQQITAVLEQSKSVVIFPEGTFTRAVGIRPFKLGTFKVAVETGCAICPIAIRGTRHILPSKRWIFRRRKIEVIITEPLLPESKDFHELKHLRDEVRQRLIQLTGEPALNLVSAAPPKN